MLASCLCSIRETNGFGHSLGRSVAGKSQQRHGPMDCFSPNDVRLVVLGTDHKLLSIYVLPGLAMDTPCAIILQSREETQTVGFVRQ